MQLAQAGDEAYTSRHNLALGDCPPPKELLSQFVSRFISSAVLPKPTFVAVSTFPLSG
jgi:hypothetical protein